MTLNMGMGSFIGKLGATITEGTSGTIDMVTERCFGQMDRIIRVIGKWESNTDLER